MLLYINVTDIINPLFELFELIKKMGDHIAILSI